MTDEFESREPSERSVNHHGRGLTILFTLLVCYVLSPMPMVWGLEKLGVLDRADAVLEIFYAPLTYLVERFEPVNKFYDWQFSFIGR